MIFRVFCTLIIAFWLAGALRFFTLIPDTPARQEARAGGIVVLTGGSRRVDEGITLLQRDESAVMLISGVGGNADLTQVTAGTNITPEELAALEPLITLDYDSRNTRENALAIRAWAEEKKLKKIRLITSNYHMPRAMAELRAALPDFPVIRHPVFTPTFRKENWWNHPNSTAILIHEYHKWLITLLRREIGFFTAKFANDAGNGDGNKHDR